MGINGLVPSARAAYPLQLYVVSNNVHGLADGLYKFDVTGFKLLLIKKGNFSESLATVANGQTSVKDSQIRVIITVLWDKLTAKMGEMGRKYGSFEAGLASQNSFLVATALGLNTVPVGGMDENKAAKFIGLNARSETPIIINVFGR